MPLYIIKNVQFTLAVIILSQAFLVIALTNNNAHLKSSALTSSSTSSSLTSLVSVSTIPNRPLNILQLDEQNLPLHHSIENQRKKSSDSSQLKYNMKTTNSKIDNYHHYQNDIITDNNLVDSLHYTSNKNIDMPPDTLNNNFQNYNHDMIDSKHFINDFNRENHIQHDEHDEETSGKTSTLTSGLKYPWNLYHSQYAQEPLNYLPPPSSLTSNQMFSNILSPFEALTFHPNIISRFMTVLSYPSFTMIYPSYIPTDSIQFNVNNLLNRNSNYDDDFLTRIHPSSRHSWSIKVTQPTIYHPSNSPIYYMKIPSTPYTTFMPNSHLWPHQTAYSSLPYSPIFNIPLPFLANGKPNNIYQIGGSNDIQNHFIHRIPSSHFNIHSTSTLHTPVNSVITPFITNNYHPGSYATTNQALQHNNYLNIQALNDHNRFGTHSTTPLTTIPLKDSKLTALKRPYFFNGRPEDIFVLRNNLKSFYSSDQFY